MNMQKGFTLVELIITVVIVSILAAVAIPNYQSYLIRARRTSATGCLLELSQSMERFYTVNLRYDQDKGGTAVALPNTQCQADLTGHYTFALAASGARTYTLEATPSGMQANDPQGCGKLGINQAGTKTAEGPVDVCWR